MIWYRGMMTLTLLLLLSSMLFIVLLFDDDILRLNSALVSQRMRYVKQSLDLQERSQQGKLSTCSTVPLSVSGSVYQVVFQQDSFKDDDHQHYIWCERYMLFKQLPTKATYEGKFHHYVDNDKIALFRNKLQTTSILSSSSKTDHFYWFDKAQSEFKISGNMYAVIIAEGDLHLSGKGKISGSVITGGVLTIDPEVSIVYRKSTVNAVVQQQSQWHRAEKSWYDFNP